VATLTFNGAAQEVTGSCYLLRTANSIVILDCGLRQGNAEAESRNRAQFSFDVRRLDAVILSHAHLDHSGLLPRLVRAGYHGRIFCTPATADLLRVLLMDAAYLHLKDIEADNRWLERAGKPLLQPDFTPQDVEKACKLCEPISYHQSVAVTPDMNLVFRNAGHILGAAIVQLHIDERGRRRGLVFSGDLGTPTPCFCQRPKRSMLPMSC